MKKVVGMIAMMLVAQGLQAKTCYVAMEGVAGSMHYDQPLAQVELGIEKILVVDPATRQLTSFEEIVANRNLANGKILIGFSRVENQTQTLSVSTLSIDGQGELKTNVSAIAFLKAGESNALVAPREGIAVTCF